MRKRLGQILVDAGLIEAEQLALALAEQRRRGGLLGKTLVDMGLIGENQLVKVLALHLNIATVRLSGRVIDPSALSVLDELFCRENQCLPLEYHVREKYLEVAMVEPTNERIIEQIRDKARCNVHPYIAGPTAVSEAIEAAYTLRSTSQGSTRKMPSRAWRDAVKDAEWQPPAVAARLLPALEPPDSFEIDIDLSEESRLSGEYTSTVGTGELPAVAEPRDARIEALREEIAQMRTIVEYTDQLLRGLVEQLQEQGVLQTRAHGGHQTSDLRHPAEIGSARTQGHEELGATTDDSRSAQKTNLASSSAPVLPIPGRKQSSVPLVVMDFGTSYASVAVVTDGQALPLRLPSGSWDMPSVVGCRHDGSVLLGNAARTMLATDPTRAIASPKRLLGRLFNDPKLEAYLGQIAMATTEGTKGEIVLKTPEGELRVPEACAHILYLLRLVAERELGRKVRHVLLPIPVAFDDHQVEALQEAASIAGLKRVRFVEEPIAAAYGNISDTAFDGLVAVYDFGGGTFDFSVVEVKGDRQVKVVTTAGDTWLGGDDFDLALAGAAANSFWQRHEIELRNQVLQWQRLLAAAETAKRELSDSDQTKVAMTEAAIRAEGPLDLSFPVSRAEFATLSQSVIDRSLECVEQALALSGIRPKELNAVYLSGGTCYIPAVREAMTTFFGKAPKAAVRPERAVLLGAAMYGALVPPSS